MPLIFPTDYGKHLLLPENQFKDFVRPAPFIPDSPGHQAEWLNAIKNGTPTGSPFSYAGPLTEANHLGNVAPRRRQNPLGRQGDAHHQHGNGKPVPLS